ncbi:MAG: hypothetical protein KJ701_06410 [Proteobacteria bacterium]|nr:hypothetical protein [Pseudomonadota bacterium]
MAEDRPETRTPLLQRNWLRRTLLALGAGALVLAAIIIAIPPLASSNWARAKVEQALASATGKPAALRLLSLGWSDGLRLEGLRIGQGVLNDESFLCSLERLHVEVGLLSILRKDLRLRIEGAGLRLRQRLEPGSKVAEPPLPPSAKPLSARIQEALSTLREGLRPTPRRGDMHVRVDLSDMTVRLDLAASNSTLDLRDASVQLIATGLGPEPLRLDAGFVAVLNGRQLSPVRIEAEVEDLVGKAGLLAPAQARLEAKAVAPGLSLAARGSVAKGFQADLRLDLAQAGALLKPFAGSALPEASGALTLGLTLAQPAADRLALGLSVVAEALRASGGPLGTKDMGPFSLILRQESDIDLSAGSALLPGSLSLLKHSAMRWQGEAAGLNGGRPRITLAVHPLHLQLDEILSLARAYLPPGLRLGAATLDVEGVDLKALLPEQAGQRPHLEASIAGLALAASAMTRSAGPERLSLAKARWHVDSAQAVLPGDGPGRVEVSATADIEGLRLTGPSPLGVKHAAATLLSLKMDDFDLNPAALFGILGNASLHMACEAQGIDLPGKALAPALSHTLALRADFPASKNATASLDGLDLDIPRLRMLPPGKKPLEAPLSLRLSAPDIRLGGPAPLTANVTDARLALDLGQALRCTATGSLGGADLRSSGKLNVDVQRLLGLAAPLLPRQAKGSGGLDLDWRISAALPPQQAPAPKAEKLSQTLRRLGFLKEFEAVLNLTELALDWPLGAKGQPGETLRLRGLTTPRPLRLATSGGLRNSSLTGSLAFGPLSELPGAGPLSKPLRGLLTFNLAQQDARSMQFSQMLHLDGLDLDQNLRLTLDRLDQVLDRDQDRLAAILEQVDGTLGFGLKAGFKSLPASSGKGLAGQGNLEAGFDARLSAGRSLSLSARLLSPGMDLRLGPELALSGLTSTLRLDKGFTLTPGLRCAAPAQSALPPLSEQVFEPVPTAAGSGDEFARAILHEFQSGGGSLGFSQIKLKSGALPLNLRDVHLRLDTSGPLPALRSFRAGLLGGNLLGSAMITGSRGNYALQADCAFTGIDPARLFPDKALKDAGDQSETAGRVSLSAPLTMDPEALLRRLSLNADITRIGPRTLERMLYALDPDEQNEAIVQQRRLMGIGYPRFVHLGMAYGNLSLSGEVEVKGFRLELPRIDRLPAANLPIRKQLAKALVPVPALVNILDAISAGGICRDPAGPPGALKVVQNTVQEGVAP